MEDNKNLTTAIELAKAFIQNNNVKPMYSRGDLVYGIQDGKLYITNSFKELVSMFLDELEIIDRWEL